MQQTDADRQENLSISTELQVARFSEILEQNPSQLFQLPIPGFRMGLYNLTLGNLGREKLLSGHKHNRRISAAIVLKGA